MALRWEKLSDSLLVLLSDNTVVLEVDGTTINLRGTVKMGSDLISPSASELAALDGLTATSTELNNLAGVAAGTVTASKAVVVGANKNLDTLSIADSGLKLGSGAGTAVTKTAAQLNALVAGVAGGYVLARGATALDGSNPTTIATGLTTIVAAMAVIKRTDAITSGTAQVTVDFTGSDGNLDVYGWILAGTASTGTETVEWIAIGT